MALEPLSAFVALEKELALPGMASCLTIWYRRASMIAESGCVRITLDERLTFCRAQIVGVVGAEVAPSPADVIAPGPARILEIKHWGERPAWLAQAIGGLDPARSFSKFKMGMAALNRRLESLVHPIVPSVAPVAVEVDVDPETDPAVNTYFAPNPGTA